MDDRSQKKSNLVYEALKRFTRRSSATKLHMQQTREMEQLANARGPPTNSTTMNKLMAAYPGLNNSMLNNQAIMHSGTLGGAAQAASDMTNYHNLLARQNSRTLNPTSIQQESSSFINNSNLLRRSVVQGQSSLVQGPMQNLPVGGFPNVLTTSPMLI